MAKYYFDTYDGAHASVDDVGIDCDSAEQIEECAVDALPDIARDEIPNGPERLFWVKVRDGAGRFVFEASLSLDSHWLVDDL